MRTFFSRCSIVWPLLALCSVLPFFALAAVGQQSPSSQDPSPPVQQSQAHNKNTQPADPKPEAGKSKLEEETGTVNDRIFEVMPNYGTVEGGNALPPLSTGQKFRLATAGVTDYFAYPFNAGLAAIGQANNSPQSWGQGWGAYAKRFGSTYADNTIGTYMTTAIYPTLLREDPRYYQLREGSFKRRAVYPIARLFVTRTDSGGTRFNISEVVGNATAAGLSNLYHAPEDRTLGRNLSSLGMLLMWDGVSNEMKEFWPDIRRKVFHKKTP
jgi:hypothetical protein